ncbi:MAG: metal-dependent transcriptional regulator [Chloroflexales bacterium]|nr:metal-dependent transcriptional regulator [Chloroflexales bacterium]
MVALDETTKITPAIEDYLKAIYTLQQAQREVGTSLLSEQLDGKKPGSVTGMLKRLAELKLVAYTPYQGVRLTETGTKIALEVVRHHRLIELYLVEALGYSWDEVHDEAENLEHHISEKLEARIAARLGHPRFDPHGDPIPAPDGALPAQDTRLLANVPPGSSAIILRVTDQHAARLRYLAGIGLVPGAPIDVVGAEPFDGPISVRVCDVVHPLDRRLARLIAVSPA